jgi:hypothetical protein
VIATKRRSSDGKTETSSSVKTAKIRRTEAPPSHATLVIAPSQTTAIKNKSPTGSVSQASESAVQPVLDPIPGPPVKATGLRQLANPPGPRLKTAGLKTRTAAPKTSRFQPLTITANRPSKQTTVFSRESRPDVSTSAGRHSYVEQSFLNSLFKTLNARREIAIRKAPYPSPVPYSNSTIVHLAFQGLDPRLYVERTTGPDFMIAWRFWISRLYSMLSLGSGQAWSKGAGGLGILPPDLSQWPAVTHVRTLRSGLAEVTTSEDVRYIVVPITGDVIAHSTHSMDGICPMRADWETMDDGGNLTRYIKTKDMESMPGGISATWRKRATDEEFALAERVVLSSCNPER